MTCRDLAIEMQGMHANMNACEHGNEQCLIDDIPQKSMRGGGVLVFCEMRRHPFDATIL